MMQELGLFDSFYVRISIDNGYLDGDSEQKAFIHVTASVIGCGYCVC